MMVGEVSHPSRLRMAAFSPFHREASLTQRRSRKSWLSRASMVSWTAGSLKASSAGRACAGAAAATGSSMAGSSSAGVSPGTSSKGRAMASAATSSSVSRVPGAAMRAAAGCSCRNAPGDRVTPLSSGIMPASRSAILDTVRMKRSSPEKEAASHAEAISTARSASSSRAPRHRTLASSSSRERRAASGSWQREARMPRILFAAMDAPVPLPQISRPVSTKPRSTACPTARA